MRTIFLFLMLLFVISLASAFPIGVSFSPQICVKPGNDNYFEIQFQSFSDKDEIYHFYPADNNNTWIQIKDEYLTLTPGIHNHRIDVNTTDIKSGIYERDALFCLVPTYTANESSIVSCISPKFMLNISESCPELPKINENQTNQTENTPNNDLETSNNNLFYINLLFIVLLIVVLSFVILKKFKFGKQKTEILA
jgi:hypothetical protein